MSYSVNGLPVTCNTCMCGHFTHCSFSEIILHYSPNILAYNMFNHQIRCRYRLDLLSFQTPNSFSVCVSDKQLLSLATECLQSLQKMYMSLN